MLCTHKLGVCPIGTSGSQICRPAPYFGLLLFTMLSKMSLKQKVTFSNVEGGPEKAFSNNIFRKLQFFRRRGVSMATTGWVRAVVLTSINTNTTLAGKGCCWTNFRGGQGNLFSRLGRRQQWEVFSVCPLPASREYNPAWPHAEMAESNQALSPWRGQEPCFLRAIL